MVQIMTDHQLSISEGLDLLFHCLIQLLHSLTAPLMNTFLLLNFLPNSNTSRIGFTAEGDRYLTSFVWELKRFSGRFLGKRAKRNVILTTENPNASYLIPSGTLLLASSLQIQMTESTIWKDPFIFDPRRYIVGSSQIIVPTLSDGRSISSCHLWLFKSGCCFVVNFLPLEILSFSDSRH